MERIMKKYADIVTGIVVVIIGIATYFASFNIRVAPGAGNISASTVPRICSVIFILLGIMLTFQGIKIYNRMAGEKSEKIAKDEKKKLLDSLAGIAAVILIFAVYILALPVIGFLLCTPVFIFLIALLLMPRSERTRGSVIKIAVVSVISTGAIYALFVLGFSILLPSGILG